MAYRFLKIKTFPRYYLEEFYRRFPLLQQESYDNQYRTLMADAYGSADFFSKNLRKLGVDACDIVANAGHLQRAWAAERNCRGEKTKIVEEQIASFKPHVVFFEEMNLFNDQWIACLRERVKSIKLVTGYVCSPITLKVCETSKAYDVVFCCGPGFTTYVRSIGLKAYELNHAFETDILNHINVTIDNRATDLVFIGSLIPSIIGNSAHNQRIEILNDLIGIGINMKIYTNGNPYRLRNIIMKNAVWYTYKTLSILGLKKATNLPIISLARGWDGPVRINSSLKNILRISEAPKYGLEMYKTLASSRMALNNHAQIAGDCAVNMRMFEVTGAGACLITDHKKNIKDFFMPDYEIITYKSIEEVSEKIKWLIEHPADCAEVAMAGYRRTLKDHTMYNRAELLHSILLKELHAPRRQ